MPLSAFLFQPTLLRSITTASQSGILSEKTNGRIEGLRRSLKCLGQLTQTASASVHWILLSFEVLDSYAEYYGGGVYVYLMERAQK